MKKYHRMSKEKSFREIKRVIEKTDEDVEKFSIIDEMLNSNSINRDFIFVLDSLSLEDIIALKLEMSLKTLNKKILNLGFMSNLEMLIEKVVLTYALSISNTYAEVAVIVGARSIDSLLKRIRKHKIKTNSLYERDGGNDDDEQQ